MGNGKEGKVRHSINIPVCNVHRSLMPRLELGEGARETRGHEEKRRGLRKQHSGTTKTKILV